MDRPPATPNPCLDCGTPSEGSFCPHCGLRRQDPDLRLRHVLKDVFEDLFNLDARILATLRLLFLKPGQLTLEYFAGRRARYLPPFRLYIFVSFLLFLLMGTGSERARVSRQGQEAVVADIQIDGAVPGTAAHRRVGLIKRGLIKAGENPAAFKGTMLLWISRVMFLLLPAFAAILHLFHRRGTYFVQHVIFSLHFHAFAFSLFIAEGLLSRVPFAPVRAAGGLLVLALPVHLCLALKRVHGGPAWKRHLKGIALSALYLMVVGLALLGVVLWVLSRD